MLTGMTPGIMEQVRAVPADVAKAWGQLIWGNPDSKPQVEFWDRKGR